MKKTYLSSALALVLSLQIFSVHAFSNSFTNGQYTTKVAGVQTETFSDGLPANYIGGEITSSNLNVPVGGEGNYWSVGPEASIDQDGSGVVTFNTPVKYFGFLWGSPELDNTVNFYDGTQLIGTFSGAQIPPPNRASFSVYFNGYAGENESITKITFSSATHAFETDNHSFAAAVPEPGTYAMLLAGLGLIALLSRRRRFESI